MVKAIVSRHKGHVNAPAPARVIGFLNVLHVVLELSQDKMCARIQPWTQNGSAVDESSGCVLLSVGLDATRLFKTLAPITSFKKIVGKQAPTT